LIRHVVFVDPEMVFPRSVHTNGFAAWQSSKVRHGHLDHEAAAELKMRGDVLEARDLLVLARRVLDRVEDQIDEGERRLNRRRGEVADRDPICSALGLARSLATIASDRSIPWTRRPRWARGMAIRPVPMPSSSAAPLSANSKRKSTAGSTTDGSNISTSSRSYRSATCSPK
jgi:hypothetical protein